ALSKIACNRLQKELTEWQMDNRCDRSSGDALRERDLSASDILYDSWSPAMTVSSVCINILSMLSSSPAKERPADNDRYVKNCKNRRSPKETRWWFHDDKV
ncbi:hypothetical protein IGI04_040131, partial [Brassica rapa subsp. trilocularis]